MNSTLEIDEIVFKKEGKWFSVNNLCFTYSEAEKIKNWLERLTTPRYEVKIKRNNEGEIFVSSVFDKKLKKTIAAFYPTKDFNCARRAEEYCEEMNIKERI